MKRLTTLLSLLAMALMFASTNAAAQSLHACDWEAAHPSDPDHVGPGRSSSDVNTGKAIAACRNAIAAYPDEARFHYQLGRAMVYEADRAEADWRVGMPPLLAAAEMRHTQAMFVVGLMHKRDGNVCAAEPWTRAAANQALKSARIAYVNDYLSGALTDCPEHASHDDMQAYLDAARSQVSGYYENMLLDTLGRQLATHGQEKEG